MPHAQILRHAQIPAECQLLVNHGHPGIHRIARGVKAVKLPVDEQLPAVGLVDAREHLPKGGLARAVLAHQPVAFATGNVERHVL